MQKFMVGVLLTASLAGVSAGQSSTDKPAPGSSAADDAVKPKKPKAKHVYTNEDIPEHPRDTGTSSNAGSSGSSASATATASSDAPAAAAGKGDAKAKGTKSSKGEPSDEVKAAQAKVDSLKKEEQGISTVIQHIENAIAQGGEYRRNSMGDGLRKQQSDLEETRKKREAAQQELNDLQAPK